jgi:hypothetical protein
LERIITDDDDDDYYYYYYSRIDNVAQRLEGRRLHGCFNQLEQRWDKCLASEGDKNDVADNT